MTTEIDAEGLAGGETANEAMARPGSYVALVNGCTCPTVDNAHGNGAWGKPDQFWITEGCPLHAPRLDATVRSGEEG